LKTKVKIVVAVILLYSVGMFSQNIDSLKVALNKTTHDTARARLLVAISDVCEIEEIEGYARQAIQLCEQNLKGSSPKNKLNAIYLKYLAASYNNMGFISDQHGDIPKALEYYNKALEIQERINDKMGIAYSLNNIGYVYNNLNDVPQALEYFHKSLKIQEEISDKYGLAVSYINIGTIYKDNGNLAKAIDYFEKSLKLKTEINDKEGIAISLLNIGAIHYKKGGYQEALDYFIKGYKLYDEVGDKNGLAYANINMGYVYQDMGNIDKAMECFQKSLEIQEETKDKAGIARSLHYIAKILFLKGNTAAALKDAEKSLEMSRELGYPEPIMLISYTLSRIYFKTGNYKEAYQMQVLFKQMSDSLKSVTNRKSAIQKSFQYEYEKKVAADSVKVVEERKVFAVKMQQEKTQRLALYCGIGLIALFSAFMYNRFRITRKQKQIIETQKLEVDQQRELADKRRVIAEEQKQIIEQKQKEILDSIHYAKRIQQAMLTSEEYMTRHFSVEKFIFYQPKDIVSGDFYWALHHHNRFYIAAADCTGHGVPGAFMSLLNISFLNGNVIERGILEPDQILNEQRREIIKALNPNGTENSKDGMDCALCAFDLGNNTLKFALANNPLWLIRNNELIEYKADKMPVGKYDESQKDFTLQTIQIIKGDSIYIFTDGYADQFGGEKGKKFKYKHLKETLLANVHLSMEDQKVLLANTINEWKGDLEQVDDILVIGIRI